MALQEPLWLVLTLRQTLWHDSAMSNGKGHWPVHEKYNGKEYTTRIEEAWDQPGDVGQRGRVAVDNP